MCESENGNLLYNTSATSQRNQSLLGLNFKLRWRQLLRRFTKRAIYREVGTLLLERCATIVEPVPSMGVFAPFARNVKLRVTIDPPVYTKILVCPRRGLREEDVDIYYSESGYVIREVEFVEVAVPALAPAPVVDVHVGRPPPITLDLDIAVANILALSKEATPLCASQECNALNYVFDTAKTLLESGKADEYLRLMPKGRCKRTLVSMTLGKHPLPITYVVKITSQYPHPVLAVVTENDVEYVTDPRSIPSEVYDALVDVVNHLERVVTAYNKAYVSAAIALGSISWLF